MIEIITKTQEKVRELETMVLGLTQLECMRAYAQRREIGRFAV